MVLVKKIKFKKKIKMKNYFRINFVKNQKQNQKYLSQKTSLMKK